MNKKSIFITIIIIILIIAGALYWYFSSKNILRFSSDVDIEGDYVVERGERMVLKDGAKLTINGNLTVKGEIVCENGPLRLVVSGIILIENKLECDRGQELEEDDSGLGISIVVGTGIETTKDAQIITNGHIQIVNNEEDLATTRKEFETLYEEAGRDSGEGNRIGPFVPMTISSNEPAWKLSSQREYLSASIFKTPIAHAVMFRLNGHITINTPPRGVNLITVFNIPNTEGLLFDDFTFTGPDGNDGLDGPIECFSEGEDGQNAMRLLAYGSRIIINKLTLNLGSGGNGGTGITPMDGCSDAKAIGGNGGKAGDFKFIASEEFTINGSFVINPGKAGDAGDAYAYGKNGGPNEPGGKATATGGTPQDNKKAIRAIGVIAGTDNISINSMIGGRGGSAYALGGNGGDGVPCPNDGAKGGDAIAKAGKGGDALIYLTGTGASRVLGAEDIAGDAGVADALAGNGGDGADCDCESKKIAGNGGNGGDAKITAKSGGMSGIPSNDGKDTEIKKHKGGDGGDGGDGYIPGGKGIKGTPNAKDGKMGEVLDCDSVSYDPVSDPTLDPISDPVLADNINVSPDNVRISHRIGSSPCPQFMSTLSLSKTGSGDASNWGLVGSPPYWIDMPTSGSIPDNISINFNCILEQYVSQTLSASLEFQLFNDSGDPSGDPVIVTVNLEVIGE